MATRRGRRWVVGPGAGRRGAGPGASRGIISRRLSSQRCRGPRDGPGTRGQHRSLLSRAVRTGQVRATRFDLPAYDGATRAALRRAADCCRSRARANRIAVRNEVDIVMSGPLLQRVDCVHVEVPDLEAGLAFYRDKLGHELLWRRKGAAGLKMAEGDTEIVMNVEPSEHKTDLHVGSAATAGRLFEEGGGSVLSGPFDIDIGRAVVVRDPWGNEFVLLDTSKGLYATDAEKNVIGVEPPKQ